MSKVYLVYEDDYGGTFSPMFLTKIFVESAYNEALSYIKDKKGLAVLQEAENKGLDKSQYKQSIGGLFQRE